MGTNLIRYCKKARVSFSMWGYGQMGLEADGVWGRQGQGQMGLGANASGQRPHNKQHPGFPATRDQVCSPRSQPCLRCFPLADQRFLGSVKDHCLRRRLGSNLFPHSQAKNPPEISQSLSFNGPAPLQHYQVEASYLRARQILGHPPSGFDLPPKNDKINIQCIFFHY